MTNNPLMTDDPRVKPADDQQQVNRQTDDQAQQTAYPPLSTEQKEAVGSLYKEGEPGVIEKKEFVIPKEVTETVKEIKKADSIKMPEEVPFEDEYGRVLLESARPTKLKIVLPLDNQGMKWAAKKKIVDAAKWLYYWCKRAIQMFPGRVVYKTT